MRGLGAWIVVDGGRIDFQHLFPEHLLRRADIADAFEQFVEVVRPDVAPGLEALIVLLQSSTLPERRPGGGVYWLDSLFKQRASLAQWEAQ